MGNEKIITLVDNYQEVGEVELICAFEVPELSGKYVIYTKNEKDKYNNTIIYSGKVIDIDGNQCLENISEGHEWEKLKEIMKAMARHSLEGETNVCIMCIIALIFSILLIINNTFKIKNNNFFMLFFDFLDI